MVGSKLYDSGTEQLAKSSLLDSFVPNFQPVDPGDFGGTVAEAELRSSSCLTRLRRPI